MTGLDITTSLAARSAGELAERLAAQRDGAPFLLLRDPDGRQILVTLDDRRERLTLGRDAQNDVVLAGDGEISRVHAELLRVGGHWVIADQGISRNGTFHNGVRIQARQRLVDGDVLRLGRTVISVTVPAAAGGATTVASSTAIGAGELTPIQRQILAALARPLLEGGAGALPAANGEIAETVHLSVAGVKSQLRNLAERFGYGELPPQGKRRALAERAVALGLGRASS